MQIKTKRGPRRIRNQRVRDHRYVVTDYTGCTYVTAGKLYRLFKGTYRVMSVMDDDLDEIPCIPGTETAHFDLKAKWYHPIR